MHAAIAPRDVRSRIPPGSVPWWLLLVAATLVLRAPDFGNPVYHIDDQFYRLVGNAVLRGELPYVDVWDRKPLGLFLLYAAVAAYAGEAAYGFQLVAGAFALATALVVARLARRIAAPLPACLAGVAYLAALAPLGGNGGQSPVFYNLLIACAALLTWDASERADGFAPRAIGAMALAGLAVFIKQVSLFEGAFFGCVLLWTLWKRTGSPAAVLRWGTLFAFVGVAPNALALGGYALAGHADAWWFANVTSIFLKTSLDAESLMKNAALIGIIVLPLAVCALVGLRMRARTSAAPAGATRFLSGWLATAFAGFLAVPNFFDHYALPLLVPLCVAAATLFDRRGSGPLWALCPILWGMVMSSWPTGWDTRSSVTLFAELQAAVDRHIGDGCVYVWEGPVELYARTRRCRLSPYLFPDHLNSRLEAGAIGVPPEAELRRILDRRPTVVVTTRRAVHPTNYAALRVLAGTLIRDYDRRALVRGRGRGFSVWVLKPRRDPAQE